jgi:uncharacterized protein YdaU (DUF1376 family)
MNYYPFHLGDYATHTAHLDMLEDLAYRRLLDLYYLREAPIPSDVQEAARLIRMKAQAEYVEAVLREFFELSEDGWRHGRCDDELARMQDKQAKARASAEASVKARQAKALLSSNDRPTDAQPTLDVGATNVELPTPTPTPTPSTTTSLRSVGDAKTVTVKRPDDVPPEIWRDFQAVRKAKRSPLTPKAFEGIEREAKKAGLTITEALTICIERGWQGFQASWDWKRTATRGPTPENFAAKDYGKGGDL